MDFEVVDSISQEDFVEKYVKENKPVIVRNTIFEEEKLNPDFLGQLMGDLPVQVYDSLFNLQEVATLKKYFQDHFGHTGEYRNSVPYIRWYNTLKDVEYAWSDEAFSRLSPYWKKPDCIPNTNLVVPVAHDGKVADPVRDLFPYRGILVAARGARTRTHTDPFCSDAIVCQFYGQKEVSMYHPDRKEELSQVKGVDNSYGGFIDVRKDNLNEVSIEPDYHGYLNPGDMVYVPHGWIHDVIVTEDSISVTWNFVHEMGALEFVDYLMDNPINDSEFEVLNFFYSLAGNDFTSPSEIIRKFNTKFAEIEETLA